MRRPAHAPFAALLFLILAVVVGLNGWRRFSGAAAKADARRREIVGRPDGSLADHFRGARAAQESEALYASERRAGRNVLILGGGLGAAALAIWLMRRR